MVVGFLIIGFGGLAFLASRNRPTEQLPTATSTPTPLAVHTLSPNEANTLLSERQADSSFIILDVRTADEYASGHIKNAKNLDYYSTDISAQVANLDHSKTYLIYCRTGHRSGSVTGMMQSMGFKTINDLQGGIQAWQVASLPIE